MSKLLGSFCVPPGEIPVFPSDKQRQEGCKPAVFLEQEPTPVSKQLSNRCLCQGVWSGAVGRGSTRLLVTFGMAAVQGLWNTARCLMWALPEVSRCFIPWRTSADPHLLVFGAGHFTLLTCWGKQINHAQGWRKRGFALGTAANHPLGSEELQNWAERTGLRPCVGWGREHWLPSTPHHGPGAALNTSPWSRCSPVRHHHHHGSDLQLLFWCPG